jgi:hypothetical protein
MIRLVIACLLALLSFYCKEQPPEPGSGSPLLAVEDASCTEVWLHVLFADGIPYHQVILTRDGNPILSSTVRATDTLIVDEGLLPSHSYAYDLTVTGIFGIHATAQARTMDTTSHNFNWEVDTLGVGTSSFLYDVAITNDTLAYAVGEVYVRDTLGNLDALPYNVAKWNGVNWRLVRVTVGFRGSPITVPLNGIFAFSSHDIWLTGGLAIHGDGNTWIGHDVRTVTGYDTLDFTKCWGASTNNLYCVGLQGSLAHYDGSTWQKISSGTTVTLNDVWGGSNVAFGKGVVYIAVGNKYTGGETFFLKVDPSGAVARMPWADQARPRQSIWFDDHSAVFTCGAGVFSWHKGQWRYEASVPSIYTNRVRGNAVNDVFVVADFGLVVHYNGLTWHTFDELRLPAGNYESVAVKNGLVIAVGWQGVYAIALSGRRI